MDTQQDFVIVYSAEAAKVHRGNLKRNWHFCGWIPAQCLHCDMVGIFAAYLAPETPSNNALVIVLCPTCGWQHDWSTPFALLAQRPMNFTANVDLPSEPPDWLGCERFASIEEALRYYLEQRQESTSEQDAAASDRSNDTPAAALLRAKVREWANQMSGIHAGTESPEAAERLSAEYQELMKGMSEQEALPVFMAGVRDAYLCLPSKEELVRSRSVLMAKMQGLATLHVGDVRPSSWEGRLSLYKRALGNDLIVSLLSMVIGTMFLTNLPGSGVPRPEDLKRETGMVGWVQQYGYGVRFGFAENTRLFDYPSKGRAVGFVNDSLESAGDDIVSVLYDPAGSSRPIYTNREYFNVWDLQIAGQPIRTYEEITLAWQRDDLIGQLLGAVLTMYGLVAGLKGIWRLRALLQQTRSMDLRSVV